METTYAYLAGAIDLDGYVYISRRSRPLRTEWEFSARIGLSDISPIIPELLQDVFPASRRTHLPKKPGEAGFSVWEARGATARIPLVCLIPYFRAKRRQAELTLAFLDNRARATDLYEECSRLNTPRRGRKFRIRAPTLAFR